MDSRGATETSLPERPFHSKRPHRKSRGGCRNCKARKIKCSEDRPQCRTCVLRMEECVYALPTAKKTSRSVVAAANAASSKSSSPPPSASSPSSPSEAANTPQPNEDFAVLPVSPQLAPRPAQSDYLDMKLLWFYTAKGCESFNSDLSEYGASKQSMLNQTLRFTIPRIALEHRFLMDCMLGLSALQMTSMENEKIPMSRIMLYNSSAMKGYRQAIEAAKPRTFNALLTCSLFMCALSSENFRQPNPPPLFILEWIVVWKGISLIYGMIVQHTGSPLKGGSEPSGLASLFSRPPVNGEEAARYIPGNLLFMVSSLKDGDEEFPYVQAYYSTLKVLGALYMDLEHTYGPILTLRVITFFTFVPPSFVEAAREKRPRALIIIAHWLAFSKLATHIWWMRGLADHEVYNISNTVGDEYRQLMQVPLAAVDIDDYVELGRLLSNNYTFEPVRRRLADLPPDKLPALFTDDEDGNYLPVTNLAV
ncbi:hypothetical protein PspLS_00836 [Pyricularia sp. CBS 133598]|nr:hypothetical protein PspLS_00836 [Pyricularia sp. CBS 133598]